jgi:hypothetical protein
MLRLLGIFPLFHVALGAAVTRVTPRDAVPGLTYDPNTTTYCSWWVDLTTPEACSTVLSDNGVTLEAFRRWVRKPCTFHGKSVNNKVLTQHLKNPSVPEKCETLEGGRSYCVEALLEPTKTTPPTTTPSTGPGNGVSTPVPTQPGMISNCNKFHFVQQGQSCATIAALYSISVAQFIQWNPAARDDCSGLWGSTVRHLPGSLHLRWNCN